MATTKSSWIYTVGSTESDQQERREMKFATTYFMAFRNEQKNGKRVIPTFDHDIPPASKPGRGRQQVGTGKKHAVPLHFFVSHP